MISINTSTVVAGSRHNDSLGIGILQGITLGAAVGITTQREVEHIGTIIYGIVDTLDDGGHVTRAVALHDGDGHDKCLGICTYDTDAVVGSSRDACHMGTVTVEVAHVGRIVDEVPAMQVAHETVLVVVIAFFALSLDGIGPKVGLNVRVRHIDTGVDDGNNGTLRVDNGLIPKLIDTIGGNAPLLLVERVLVGGEYHAWLLWIRGFRVIRANRGFCQIYLIVRLGKFHLGQRTEPLNQLPGGDSLRLFHLY